MAKGTVGRTVIKVAEVRMLPYDLEGPLQSDMGWLPVSFDRKKGEGSYLMRMEPGAETIAHDHPGFEDFVVLEGELID